MVGIKHFHRLIFYTVTVFFSIHFAYAKDNLPRKQRPTVGLVLSGGGAKGLAHIGVLKVIEDLGIPVDYVGGTSMGSIIGGLFAIGYSASEIEDICLDQDWVHLLTDQLQRSSLSVQEKEDYDKYLVSFPMQNLRFRMPSGIGAGQNVSMLLSKLSLPVSDIDDFNNFNRAFLCVATDIEKGEEVVLDHGYLPDAIRASMAIPTLFTPVEIEGRLLVDGGLVNNFPVDQVKALGADIIIGVNLGLKDYTKEELKNLAAVLEQSIFFQAKDRNKENQNLCDILISPNVYQSNAGSFANVASLIEIGKAAADSVRPELEALAVRLGAVYQGYLLENFDSLEVRSVNIEGLKNVSKQFISGKLRIKVPGKISMRELEEGIERAYGTQFFNKINYRIENLPEGGVNLILRVEEATNDLIRLGVRYDSDFRTQILLNTTFRNKFFKGTKLSLDLYAGSNPRFTAEYRINSGWKPRKNQLFLKQANLGVLPDFGIRMDFRKLELEYREEELVSYFNYQYFQFDGFISALISNAFYFEGGATYEFSGLQGLMRMGDNSQENHIMGFYGMFKIDSYDKRAYPARGFKFFGMAEAIDDFNIDTEQLIPVVRFIGKLERTFTPRKFISLKPRIESGLVLGDTISPLHKVYLGGYSSNSLSTMGTFSFSGFRLMEKMDNSVFSVGLDIRFNIKNNHHIIIENNVARTANSYHQLLSLDDRIFYGYGVKYGNNSILGPVEVGVSNSNENIGWLGFISVGFAF